MLHTGILQELLEDEVAVARGRLGGRVHDLLIDGDDVICVLTATNGPPYRLCLGTRYFDAEPCRIALVGEENRPLPGSAWPPGLYQGEHPVLGRPFVCIRGTYEYHLHPSHLADPWDRYRYRIRLADLLDHILRRCGR